jgi:hypothetical protein
MAPDIRRSRWTPVARRERRLALMWLAVGAVLWNGVYDMTLGEGIKEYLFRSVLHEAGRGPRVSLATVVDPFVFDAVWVATFWASLVTLAGLVTIRVMRGEPGK